MGKFDGMLLVSDFDNTLLYTEKALLEGRDCPEMSPRNLEGIRYWMDQGGRFAVATGRAMAAFRKYNAMVPTNAPAVVDNGGAIYDFEREKYLVASFLPELAVEHIRAVIERFPGVALELYHENDLLQVMNPSPWNEQHAKLTGLSYQVIEEITPEIVPQPIAKALFVSDRAVLDGVCDFAVSQGWRDQYELIFSSSRLLEMTARGANKGAMVLRLKEMLGCGTLICAGDHLNDLPLLEAADRAFCPANAVPEVLASGAEAVCHCLDGAIGEIIERLDRE